VIFPAAVVLVWVLGRALLGLGVLFLVVGGELGLGEVVVDDSCLISAASTEWFTLIAICSVATGVGSATSLTYNAGKKPILPDAFFPATHSLSMFLLLTTVMISPTFNLRQWSWGGM
jgi:hypothetical protein